VSLEPRTLGCAGTSLRRHRERERETERAVEEKYNINSILESGYLEANKHIGGRNQHAIAVQTQHKNKTRHTLIDR